jgi:hypothetical protein
MTLGEVDAFFAQLPIAAVDAGSPAERWRRSREARGRLDAYAAGNPTPVPTELAGLVAEVQAREAFAKYYASQAEYEFAIVPIDSLLSPQVYADVQYVDELAATLPDNPDASADFSFAFPVPTITEPMISGQSVVFSSYGPNVTANPVPSVTRRPDAGPQLTGFRCKMRLAATACLVRPCTD